MRVPQVGCKLYLFMLAIRISMLFRTVSRIVALIAVPIILCSTIFILYVGLDGSMPAIFGFERGYVAVAGLQVLAAIEMLVIGLKPNLLSQGTD
ncbi:hypothetical protein [Haloarcula rubripromontorii]|uniref:hypothetical protein n=2 Tax=Haloarcula TaxID=2237 RepID=UPI0007BB34F1|nr:hypothetical protein AV929_18400 [Haloarcula sp. K1]